MNSKKQAIYVYLVFLVCHPFSLHTILYILIEKHTITKVENYVIFSRLSVVQ